MKRYNEIVKIYNKQFKGDYLMIWKFILKFKVGI